MNIDMPCHLRKVETLICATCKTPGGNHCLINHIKKARRGPVRALGVILYVLRKGNMSLNNLSKEETELCLEFVRTFPAELKVDALYRSQSCEATDREAAAIEQGLSLQMFLLCGSSPLRTAEGQVFNNVAAALEAASTPATLSLNVAHTPSEIGKPLAEYVYTEVLLGTRICPYGGGGCEIVGRVCIDDNKTSWVEVETDGRSRSLYRFAISKGKRGFLGETEEGFGSSLVNFIILWVSGNRAMFPPACQQWPRWKSLSSWASAKKDPKNPLTDVDVIRPSSVDRVKHVAPWMELALADAVREARDFLRERDTRVACDSIVKSTIAELDSLDRAGTSMTAFKRAFGV
jgi:hypothetical protein